MMDTMFPEVKGRFGFGCMRLPMAGEEVDLERFAAMTDRFLEAGYNYFDTAHGYISEKSETAIRACLTSRHPRESYILTDKLSGNYFEKEADIRPLFQRQLAACGVEYFDFYLLHAMAAARYDHYTGCRAFEIVQELKAEGKIRHVGMSFHDTAEVLDRILTDHPELEVVQLQFNYLDFDDPKVQSRACYEVCVKHSKPVIVMEPVKGGKLADPPQAARAELAALGGLSPAGAALRFCASFPNVRMILSGMGSMEMMEDNLSAMARPGPLGEGEMQAVLRARDVLAAQQAIPCTACRYCVDGCPMSIPIPELFACVNDRAQGKEGAGYARVTEGRGRASQCVKCGKCEEICPQHLEIRSLLDRTARMFE